MDMMQQQYMMQMGMFNQMMMMGAMMGQMMPSPDGMVAGPGIPDAKVGKLEEDDVPRPQTAGRTDLFKS